MTIHIQNGTIVNAGGSQEADILCRDGKIMEVKKNLIPDFAVDETINAAGCYLFPGGIDPHVHMHLPSPAGFSSDDFHSGSRAALAGGTTTIIDFVTPAKGQPLAEAIRKRKAEAADCLTDYSFHVSPVEWRESMEEEIRHCISKEGLNSFKVYMAYKDSIGLDDADLFRVMKVVGRAGGMVTVHCEDGDEIERLRNRFAGENKLSPAFHPLSRPPETEAKAVAKAIEMAGRTGCPLYIVHVSTAAALKHIRRAQQNGQQVLAETCPQYLLLDDKMYDGDFDRAAAFVMSPPLRKKSDNQALWQALHDGTFRTVGTDHCPFTLAQKQLGEQDFRKIPNGAGGVEHRMQLLFTYGLLQGKISKEQFVALTSANAARIFGLYPSKGVIAAGSDADIVVWNPEKEKPISAKTHLQHCDINIYEGFKTTGAPEYVIANGKVVIRNGQWQQTDLKGNFLYRQI